MARIAKKKVDEDDTVEQEDKVRVRIVLESTIINGHVLAKGTVVELPVSRVAMHRDSGVPLEDVSEDDEVEQLYDVSEPYVAQEE